MASIETAIEARALAHGLSNLLGATATPMRFYPVDAQQGSQLPFVTYQVISDPPPHVMGADKESQARVQFDVWASSWLSAREVRDELLDAFDRWAGVSGGTTVDRSVCENRGFQVQTDEVSLAPRLTMEFTMTYYL